MSSRDEGVSKNMDERVEILMAQIDSLKEEVRRLKGKGVDDDDKKSSKRNNDDKASSKGNDDDASQAQIMSNIVDSKLEKWGELIMKRMMEKEKKIRRRRRRR